MITNKKNRGWKRSPGEAGFPYRGYGSEAQVPGVDASRGRAPLHSPSSAAATADTLALTPLLRLTNQTRVQYPEQRPGCSSLRGSAVRAGLGRVSSVGQMAGMARRHQVAALRPASRASPSLWRSTR